MHNKTIYSKLLRSHSNSLYCMTTPGKCKLRRSLFLELSITKKINYIISAIKWGQGNIGFCSHEKREEDCEARYVVNKRPICLDGNLSTIVHKWKAFYVSFYSINYDSTPLTVPCTPAFIIWCLPTTGSYPSSLNDHLENPCSL